MGCFDYTCECKGKTCDHVGSQYVTSNVVIEVPLNDGSLIYVKGVYEQYGYVIVNNENRFYLKQFEEFFKSWVEDDNDKDRETIFIANKVWTVEDEMEDSRYNKYYEERECLPYSTVVVELNAEKMKKCIRADTGLDIPNDREKIIRRIAALRYNIRKEEEAIAEYRAQIQILQSSLT